MTLTSSNARALHIYSPILCKRRPGGYGGWSFPCHDPISSVPGLVVLNTAFRKCCGTAASGEPNAAYLLNLQSP
jgi:hypothetical protein